MALRASEFAGEEKKKKLQREERSTEIKAVLGISEEKRSSDFKSRALIERWLQQINSLTQLNSTSHAITEHIIAVHNSLGGRRLTRKKKKRKEKTFGGANKLQTSTENWQRSQFYFVVLHLKPTDKVASTAQVEIYIICSDAFRQ